MIFLVFLALALVSVPLCGGRLRHLRDVRLRNAWLVFGAIVIQELIVDIAPDAFAVWQSELLHLASFAMAAVFVTLNRRQPGLLLIALGGGSNLAAIAANGGVMPASPAALALAGKLPTVHAFANSNVVSHPHLAVLGDMLALPAPLPLANVFSVGDVLLVFGLFIAAHATCRSRLVVGSGAADRHRRFVAATLAVCALSTGALLASAPPL